MKKIELLIPNILTKNKVKAFSSDIPIRLEDSNEVPEQFLSDLPENANYYKSFAKANIPNFTLGCFNIYRGSFRQASIPYFIMDFKINTMLNDGLLKNLLKGISIKIACVGHPACDIGKIDGKTNEESLELVNNELRKKAKIIVYKGFNDSLDLKSFTRIKGLPVAVQQLTGNFWKELNADTRSNFKRKLAKSKNVECRIVTELNQTEAEKVYFLYQQTYQKATVKFEELNLNYFLQPSSNYQYLLFYENEEMIGFAQLIIFNLKVVFRYIGLDYDKCKENNLYFNLFFKTIEIAEKEKCVEIDWGATSYQFKKKLGCKLIDTKIYFLHTNKLIHWGLSKLKFLFEPTSKDLN